MKNYSLTLIKKLETKFFDINQLKRFKIKDNHEKLIDLRSVDPSIILVPRIDNVPKTGNTILVRNTVAQKLKVINQRLKKKGLALKVVDGYRLLEVQRDYWKYQVKFTKKHHPQWSKDEIEGEAVKFCAKPELSFHPTGGAVDLTIVRTKSRKELPMGTKINVFTTKSYAHYPLLSATAFNNRKILFHEMTKEKFYNYPAEWWHFSYGTTDWALYYKKSYAIYDVVKIKK